MIGTDTEVLLKDGTGNYVSSIGLIGGSKAEPYLVDNGNLQEDNVLAEFAIDPVDSKQEWLDNIHSTFGILQVKMKEYDLEIDIKSSAHFDAAQLEHPRAKEFGCTPDFNAYSLQENTPPDGEEVGSLRSCGGHVHVSFDEIAGTDTNTKAEFVRILDLLLGVPSVLMDDDTERRLLYGQAGAHRPKEYGVEYRTLSNFWIQSDEHMEWVYDQVKRAEQMYKDGYRISYEVGTAAINCINNGDVETARSLIQEHKLEVVS